MWTLVAVLHDGIKVTITTNSFDEYKGFRKFVINSGYKILWE